jgi:hypothetical protein
MLELLLIIGCTVNCGQVSKAYKAEKPETVERIKALAPYWAAPLAPALAGKARVKLSERTRLQYQDESTTLVYSYSF